MPTFTDREFGEIVIRRSALSKRISVRVGPDGRLRATIPTYASERSLKKMIDGARDQIAKLMTVSDHEPLRDGMAIGKSHTLVVRHGEPFDARLSGSRLLVTLPGDKHLGDLDIDAVLTALIIRALRKEARAYLPRRLAYLAAQHRFSYGSVRFSHASSRWGSCSSAGTISLNIALMKLDHTLIDYVICHELSHLTHMDHSPAFWELVGTLDPAYREHRRILKTHNPSAYI